MVLVDSGRKVLEKLSEEVFAVELMDVQMPEIDGFEATAAIRRNEGAGTIIEVFCWGPIGRRAGKGNLAGCHILYINLQNLI